MTTNFPDSSASWSGSTSRLVLRIIWTRQSNCSVIFASCIAQETAPKFNDLSKVQANLPSCSPTIPSMHSCTRSDVYGDARFWFCPNFATVCPNLININNKIFAKGCGCILRSSGTASTSRRELLFHPNRRGNRAKVSRFRRRKFNEYLYVQGDIKNSLELNPEYED